MPSECAYARTQTRFDDSRLRFRITGGRTDEGHWRLWEKGYCATWRQMRSGAERCFPLQQMPDGRIEIYKPNGKVSMTIVGFK
jgi:hypothetical protein